MEKPHEIEQSSDCNNRNVSVLFCQVNDMSHDQPWENCEYILWSDWLMDRAIICPKNCDAEEVNNIGIRKLEGEEYILRSADKLINESDTFKCPTEFFHPTKLVDHLQKL